VNESERANLDEKKRNIEKRETKWQGALLLTHFTCSVGWVILLLLAIECHVCMRRECTFSRPLSQFVQFFFCRR
jgi:hypothetical protein